MIGQESFILPKGSPIQKFLNKALSAIVNRGHLDKFRQKWKLQKQDCSMENNVNPLGIKKLFTLFLIIPTGLGFGLTIFIVEMLVNQFFQKKAKKIKDYNLDDLSTNEIITMFNYFCKKDEIFTNKVSHYINKIQE